MKVESSTKLEILHSRFGGCKLEFGGDDEGKSLTGPLGGWEFTQVDR